MDKSNIIQITLKKGRGQFYSNLLDKYSGEGYGYKLDTKKKEKEFLNDLCAIIEEKMTFNDKLVFLDFLIYQVQIES